MDMNRKDKTEALSSLCIYAYAGGEKVIQYANKSGLLQVYTLNYFFDCLPSHNNFNDLYV